MAGYAVLGRRFIKQDPFCSDFLEQLVAFPALHVLVGPPQGEGSPFIVVEQGRLPFHRVVAVGARGRFPLGELLSVDILVTVLAHRRRRLEIGIDELGPEVRRLVTVDARRRPMRTLQRELGLGMIET